MGVLDWMLELVLVGLLAVTLLHAVRLQRAVAGLNRDRSALGAAVAGFDASTRHAEAGLGSLHNRAQEIAGQVVARVESAKVVKDDLAFLTERGEQLADRLEALVRAGRGLDVPRQAEAARPAEVAEAGVRLHSQAERDLLQALRGGR